MSSGVLRAVENLREVERILIETENLALAGRCATGLVPEMEAPLERMANLLYLAGRSADEPARLREYVQAAEAELQRVIQIYGSMVEYFAKRGIR